MRNNRKIFDTGRSGFILTFLICFLSSANTYDFTLYGGFGREGGGGVEQPQEVTQMSFRFFQNWENFLASQLAFPVILELPQILKIPSDWRADSTRFQNSIAVAFKGNRVAEITDVSLLNDKINITYRLDEDCIVRMDYTYHPPMETCMSVVILYWVSSDDATLHEREIVFTEGNVSVKGPPNGYPLNKDSRRGGVSGRTFDLRGQITEKGSASGLYIENTDEHRKRRVNLR